MRLNGYTPPLIALVAALTLASPAHAQYGTGAYLNVPEVPAGTITLDGQANEAAWANATEINAVNFWDPYSQPEADVTVTGKVLFSEGVLYLYVRHEDFQPFFWGTEGNPWGGEQILVGVDLPHAGGAPDGGFAGWPENLPNLGPVAYKVTGADGPGSIGITSNWGGGPDPVALGYVSGTVFVDDANFLWGVEMAIYGAEITDGGEIGFNLGGATASAEYAAGGDDGAYGYYSWQICDPAPPDATCQYPGGAVMSDARSFGTLRLGGYGTGVVQQVPRTTGAITLDGQANEAAWASAVTVDAVSFWDPYSQPDADVTVTGRLLWDNGVLYLYVRHEDFQPFFWGTEGNPWGGEQILVGVDLPHAGGAPDGGFAGWPENLPNLGPVAYKVTGADGPGSIGITSNWGGGPDPVALGYVSGTVFVDDANFLWGVEMAIFGAEMALGNQIGFNLGGATASAEYAAGGDDGAYGYYSWQICDPAPPDATCQYPGGAVMSDARSFGSLEFVTTVANEGGPGTTGAALRAAIPNPFRGTTELAYDIAGSGQVELVAYDVLGRRVAVVDAGARTSGTHRATFDASALPSGVYTLRLVVDGEVLASRRVTSVR